MAPPVATSPPAKTPRLEVLPVGGSMTTTPSFLVSRSAVVRGMRGLGLWPMAMITMSAGTR